VAKERELDCRSKIQRLDAVLYGAKCQLGDIRRFQWIGITLFAGNVRLVVEKALQEPDVDAEVNFWPWNVKSTSCGGAGS
jgi:hypothetical protein